MNKEIIAAVRDAKMRYDNAVKDNMGVAQKRQELQNFLWNAMPELLAAADEAEQWLNEYNLLVAENIKLNQQLAAAKEGAPSPKKPKG